MQKRQLVAIALFSLISPLCADEPPLITIAISSADRPEITPFLLTPLEEKYSTEANRADAITAKAEAEATKLKKLAADARLKGYRDKLAEITKTGDFDKAQQVKARITQLENEPEGESHKPSKRPRPKDTVKFGGHTYALIKEPATWHVAKQRCEEMGGHLVILDSPQEAAFVEKMCTAQFTWAGATDEEDEGDWRWVNGKRISDTRWISQDQQELNHYLAYMLPQKTWVDATSVHRSPYMCEWSN